MASAITDLVTRGSNGSARPAATTLTAIRAIAASSISVGALTGWPTTTAVHFIIYTIDTSGNKVAGSQVDCKGLVSGSTITNIVYKAGTDNGHTVGAVVEIGPTAAWADDLYSAITQDHDTQGRHVKLTDTNGLKILGLNPIASAVNDLIISNAATTGSPDIAVEGTDSNIGLTLTPKGTGGVSVKKRFDGWVTGLTVPNTVVANGNRSYTLTFNALDYTYLLSPGMRLQFIRTVTAPTQCTSLNGTTQSFSKASPNGMTFTNNFVVSAWVKLASYAAGDMPIVSRYNGTSGWSFFVQSTGEVTLAGYNAGAANISYVATYQALPLNRWVHVSAQLDMATFTATPTTSYVMFDGQDMSATVIRGGTNPTALVQAGNLEIGSSNAAAKLFPGKIAQVAIYSAKVTEAAIAATISQGLIGTETSLISAYSLSNSLNDLNANANNLTANGAATTTNADSPFAGGALAATAYTAGTTEFGIIQSVSFSTNTTVVVQMPLGWAIPTSGGISGLAYSVQKAPLGFPAAKDLWLLLAFWRGGNTKAAPVNGTWYNPKLAQIVVPIGSWDLGYQCETVNSSSGGTVAECFTTLSTTSSSETDTELSHYNVIVIPGVTSPTLSGLASRSKPISVSAATPYYLNHRTNNNGTVGMGADQPSIIFATNGYL